MSFNLTEFRARMQLDGARPNLFDVNIQFPTTVGGALPSTDISFKGRATSLPGSTVNSVPVMYFGREFKFSGNRTFQDWTVTVINDEDFVVRNALELWMNGLNNHITGTRSILFETPDSYQIGEGGSGVASVRQFSKTGDVIKEYNFVGMFPVDVSPIEMDWGANDQMEEFSVTFAYQYWTSVGPGSENTTPAT